MPALSSPPWNQFSGFRNRIINGGFDIWQYGTSEAPHSGGFSMVADRWLSDAAIGTVAVSRQSFAVGQVDVPGNPAYFARVSVVGGPANVGAFAYFAQRIESVRTLAGRRVPLTFYAKTDGYTQFGVELVQDFGAGGAPSAQVVGISSQKFSSSALWKKYTVWLDVPAIAGKTLGSSHDGYLSVIFWLSAGNSFDARSGGVGQKSVVFDISQVQIEEFKPTPFEARPLGYELGLCQRYYRLISSLRFMGYSAALGEISVPLSFWEMRATPSVSAWGFTCPNSLDNAQPVPTNVSARGGSLRLTAAATGVVGAYDGWVSLFAEL